MVFNLFFGRKTWKKGLFSPYFARPFSDHFGVFSEKSVKIVHFYPSVFLQKKGNDIDVDLLKQRHLDFTFSNNDCGIIVPQGDNSPSESRRGAQRAG